MFFLILFLQFQENALDIGCNVTIQKYKVINNKTIKEEFKIKNN